MSDTREDRTRRVYNWSAPLDGQVVLDEADVRRDFGWPDKPLTDDDWDMAVKYEIAAHGGPPADIDWPTKIERVE